MTEPRVRAASDRSSASIEMASDLSYRCQLREKLLFGVRRLRFHLRDHRISCFDLDVFRGARDHLDAHVINGSQSLGPDIDDIGGKKHLEHAVDPSPCPGMYCLRYPFGPGHCVTVEPSAVSRTADGTLGRRAAT